MEMSSKTAIMFPRPPPTSNTLSSSERSKLLRSTAKLGNILGSTPHVVDEVYVHASVPTPPKKASQRSWFTRTKKTTTSQMSDSDSDTSPAPRTSISSRASSSCSSYASTSSECGSSEHAWRSRLPEKRPPLLRLGMSKKLAKGARHAAATQPALESIPGSPPPDVETTPIPTPEEVLYPTFDSEKEDPFGAFADSSYVELDPKVPIPTFTIPSDASIRREKMRRLKRKLGDNIPVHLVFPPIAESDEEDVIIHSPTSPTFDSSESMLESETSFDSSSALITDSEREQDVVPPLPQLPSHRGLHRPRSHPRLRHEASQQAPRRSHFADTSKTLPPVPPVPSTPRTIKRRSGQFIIHYECPDDYAVDTFDGLRCAVGGSVLVDTRIGYAI